MLDVVCASGGGGACVRQAHRRSACVRPEPPPAGAASYTARRTSGMPEAKTSRDVRRPHQIELQQVVERDDRDVLRHPGGGGSQLGLKGSPATAAPGNRAALSGAARAPRSVRGDAAGNVDARERDGGARAVRRQGAIEQRASCSR